MSTNHFFFQPGVWLGQGLIEWSEVEGSLKFYTRWTVSSVIQNTLTCIQEVEIEDGDEKLINHFHVWDIRDEHFSIELRNDIMGTVTGHGFIKPASLAWEFRGSKQEFEGYELYQLKEDGSYATHAEYVMPDQSRSIIHGTLWRKAE